MVFASRTRSAVELKNGDLTWGWFKFRVLFGSLSSKFVEHQTGSLQGAYGAFIYRGAAVPGDNADLMGRFGAAFQKWNTDTIAEGIGF